MHEEKLRGNEISNFERGKSGENILFVEQKSGNSNGKAEEKFLPLQQQRD
jgi:hypothetical protein